MFRNTKGMKKLAAMAAGLACAVSSICMIPFSKMTVSADMLRAADGVSYEHSAALTALVMETQAGNVNLYLDKECTEPAILPMDTELDNDVKYYACCSTGYPTYGWQCYIYSQGAFAHVFDELPMNGLGNGYSYNHCVSVMSTTPTVSYDQFLDSHVMPFAYMRTTANSDGSYNGSNGHSLIILAYDKETVTVQEGNALGHGEIRCTTKTWDAFNTSYLTRSGRFVSHIVQPRDDYYESQFGLSYDFTPEMKYESAAFDVHRLDNECRLPIPEDTYNYSSSDDSIASVTSEGRLIAKGNGDAVVTAVSKRFTYTIAVHVASVAWDAVGDTDGNGIVNTDDAVSVLRFYAASIMGDNDDVDELQKVCFDVDDNNQVDSADASSILQYFACKNLLQMEGTAQEVWQFVLK